MYYLFLDKTWTILTFYLKICIDIYYMIKFRCIIKFYYYRFLVFPDPFSSCYIYIYIYKGLSMNILCTGNKSPMQRGFFTNSVGDLVLALVFLAGCIIFVIIFSLLWVTMLCRSSNIFYIFGKDRIRSLLKLNWIRTELEVYEN